MTTRRRAPPDRPPGRLQPPARPRRRLCCNRPLEGRLRPRRGEVPSRLERLHGLPRDRPPGRPRRLAPVPPGPAATTTGRSTTATTSWSRSRPPEDPGYGPPEVRVATMSTHTGPPSLGRPRPRGLRGPEGRLPRPDARRPSARPCPKPPRRWSMPSSPRPGASPRYTRRTLGAVGGSPVSRRNSTFLAVDADVLGPGLWVVGDSVFPGQGTMATVLSAIRVVERITGDVVGARREDWEGPTVARRLPRGGSMGRMGVSTEPEVRRNPL